MTEGIARRAHRTNSNRKRELTERVATQQAFIEFLSRRVTTLTEDFDDGANGTANSKTRCTNAKDIAPVAKQVGALEDDPRNARTADRSIEALGTALEREKSITRGLKR